MIYCKRCSLAYIRGEPPIEEVAEAKMWVPAEKNEMWMVCEKCFRTIMLCNRALTILDLDPKKELEYKKKSTKKLRS